MTGKASSDTTTPGTPGYPTDTAGCPGGEERRSNSGAHGDAYWRSLGFSSQREFYEAFERDQRRIGEEWRRNRAAPDVPAAQMPGDEIAEIPRGRRRRRPVRQVGIKLRPADYEALARAARLYGARPTTLARLLVNRGVRAVLEAERGS